MTDTDTNLQDIGEMAGMVNCSSLEGRTFIGPVQVFESIHHWSTAVYIILAVHVIPIWTVSVLTLFRLRTVCCVEARPMLALLVCVPPSLMSIITIGILLPSTGPYVEHIMEVLLSLALLLFIKLTTIMNGGSRSMLQRCDNNKVLLPLGAPPLVCLMAVKQPPITRRSLDLIRVLPGLLLLLKLSMLILEIGQGFADLSPEQNLSLEVLQSVAAIPFGLVSVYTFNMYLTVVEQLIPDSSHKSLGYILLVQIIFSDCLKLFFLFLVGSGMLTCVPPSFSLPAVEHFLKNCIKGFIFTTIGGPYLKICMDKTGLVTQRTSVENTTSPSYTTSTVETHSEMSTDSLSTGSVSIQDRNGG